MQQFGWHQRNIKGNEEKRKKKMTFRARARMRAKSRQNLYGGRTVEVLGITISLA